MIRRPPRSTPLYSSAASDVYKRQSRDPGTGPGVPGTGPGVPGTGPGDPGFPPRKCFIASARLGASIALGHEWLRNDAAAEEHEVGPEPAAEFYLRRARRSIKIIFPFLVTLGTGGQTVDPWFSAGFWAVHNFSVAEKLWTEIFCTSAFVRPARKRASTCLLYTSPSPRDGLLSRMPSSA